MPHAESVLRLTLLLKKKWHGPSVHELLEGSSASKVKPTHPDSPAQCCWAAARVRLAEPSSSPATSAPASASSGLEVQGREQDTIILSGLSLTVGPVRCGVGVHAKAWRLQRAALASPRGL